MQGEYALSPVAAEQPLLVPKYQCEMNTLIHPKTSLEVLLPQSYYLPHDKSLLELLAHAGHGHGVLAGAHLDTFLSLNSLT